LDAEIDAFINRSFMSITIANQFFDFNNIEEPVQYFMDSIVEPMNAAKTKVKTLTARKNEYTLNDALFYGNPVKKIIFLAFMEIISLNMTEMVGKSYTKLY
jgi:hypothetical protein